MASESSGTDFSDRLFKFCANIIKRLSILKTIKYLIIKKTLAVITNV
jgi:hypothetical protein